MSASYPPPSPPAWISRSGFWLFTYGSLMWNPPFDFAEAVAARVRGYHRAFCIYSIHYRGTAEFPGLVLGLDRGGSCRGRAYRFAAEKANPIYADLHKREQISGVYRELWLNAEIMGARGEIWRVRALAFAADRDHAQYAGRLSPQAAAARIASAAGSAGSCADYLRSTLAHLEALDITDRRLEDLAQRVAHLSARPARRKKDRR